jgi:hypothetical protein
LDLKKRGEGIFGVIERGDLIPLPNMRQNQIQKKKNNNNKNNTTTTTTTTTTNTARR